MNEKESLEYITKQLEKLNQYKSYDEIDLSKRLILPLFHGTDKKILSMNNKEIADARNYIKMAIKSLYELLLNNNFNPFVADFSPSLIDPERETKLLKKKEFEDDYIRRFGQDLYNKIIQTFIHVESVLKGTSKLWNYDYFCVTTGTMRAYNYAAMSSWGGELGYFTHWLYSAVKDLNLDFSSLSNDEKEAIKYVSSIYSNLSEPVILCITELGLDILEEEHSGKHVLPFSSQCSYRVLKEIDIHTFPFMELSQKLAYALDQSIDKVYQTIFRSQIK